MVLLVMLCTSLCSAAQQKDTAGQMQHSDSAKPGFVTKMKKIGADEITRSIATLKAGRIALKQDELIENIVKTSHKANDYLKIGIDSAGINANLDKLNNWYTLLSDGIFINKGTMQTSRNLSISSQLLKELIYKAEQQKNKLDKYYKDIVQFRFKIDSLSSDSSLYIFPDDSARIMEYQQKLKIAVFTLKPADSSIKHALVSVQELQTKVNLLLNTFTSGFDEIEVYRKELSGNTFKREFANLGDSIGFRRPLSEILSFSWAKGKMVLWFYTIDNVGKILALLVCILLATFFLNTLKEKVNKEKTLQTNVVGNLVFRFPFLSAILIVLSLFQFIFIDPPFIFNVWFWIIPAVCLTVIFRNFISGFWMMMWLTMLFLFALACADNVILQASRTERWYMLWLALAGTVSSCYFLLKGHKKELKEKAILYFIGFVALMEFASVISNIYGRYNLSKTLLTCGYFGVIIAILFLWTIRLINESLSHASEVYQRPEKKLFYINFHRVGNSVPSIFYVLLVTGWFVLVARNFYAYKLISDPFDNFLFAERNIGDYSFTLKSLLIFLLTLVLSVFTSRVVSYFASDHDTNSGRLQNSKEKVGLGSWLLLVRIGIISTGLFLAFAAAGIPMDKFTIIIGALSVGIGFGLQTLINNLVSGLIIAFEKPVNVGDIVEIGGKTGTMKSIGFRSSVITTTDGSNLIIPNGDLLNAHLVNWTLGNSMRHADIIVGVAYGTDLEKTGEILKNMLLENESILKFPEPAIHFEEFKNSSINIKVSFWVKHYREWSPVKSEVIAAIDAVFRQNGIVIPFPQQEIHLLSADTGKQVQDIKMPGDNTKPPHE